MPGVRAQTLCSRPLLALPCYANVQRTLLGMFDQAAADTAIALVVRFCASKVGMTTL